MRIPNVVFFQPIIIRAFREILGLDKLKNPQHSSALPNQQGFFLPIKKETSMKYPNDPAKQRSKKS
jgi:hypothetical protein